MARLNRNWMNNDYVSTRIQKAKKLKTLNTQEFNDELFKIKTKLCHGLGSSRFFMKIKQKQLNQLWGDQQAPKWLSQTLYKLSDNQIKTILDQSNKQGVPIQETITNLLMRDKKWALFVEFCNYKALIENNPVKAVDQRLRLQALINENNGLNNLTIDRTFIFINGFNRLRKISETALRQFQNLSGINNKSNHLVKVDFTAEAVLAEDVMKDINNADNTQNTKDNDFEK